MRYEDREQFRAWTTDAVNTRDRARSERGLSRLFAYGRQLVAGKRREPGDDVISRLCATEGLSDDEAAELSMGLLWAGYETTVVQIGLAALLLLANPEQWRALVDDPALAWTADRGVTARIDGRGSVICWLSSKLTWKSEGSPSRPGTLCC